MTAVNAKLVVRVGFTGMPSAVFSVVASHACFSSEAARSMGFGQRSAGVSTARGRRVYFQRG